MLLCEQQTDKYQGLACQFAEECFQTTPKPVFPYGDGSLKIHEVGRQQFESVNKCYKNASDSFSGFRDILGEWRTQRIREMFHSAAIFRQREIEDPYDARVVRSDLAQQIFPQAKLITPTKVTDALLIGGIAIAIGGYLIMHKTQELWLIMQIVGMALMFAGAGLSGIMKMMIDGYGDLPADIFLIRIPIFSR